MRISQRSVFCVNCAMCCALLAVCAWISIPTVPPFTLQSLGVFALTGIFGTSVGVTSYCLYLFLGIVGMPVFSGFSGGLAALSGPTGGYLFGFVFTVLIIGSLIKLFGNKKRVLLLSFCAGLVFLYVFASFYYALVWLRTFDLTGIGAAFSVCVLPFIPADVVKAVFAVYITKKLKGRIRL